MSNDQYKTAYLFREMVEDGLLSVYHKYHEIIVIIAYATFKKSNSKPHIIKNIKHAQQWQYKI